MRGVLTSVSYCIYISAVKRLIAINYIQNKSFCLHYTRFCVCTVYIYILLIYINTHTCMYIFKNFFYVYILNIFI